MLRHRFTAFKWIMTVLSVVSCILAQTALSAPAQAAGFPEKGKSLHIIVPYSAGGSTDVGARLLAKGLEEEIGISVVIENKPGANAQIGNTELIQSKPDGYTLGFTNFPTVIATYLDKSRKAVYSKKSFQPVALHVIDPSVIGVNSESPFKSLKDVLQAAKAAPKKITICTTGIQSDEHFAILQLQEMTGVKFAMVHFSHGGAPAMTAALGGKIDVFCGGVGGGVMPQYKRGSLRLLGIFDDRQSQFYPGVKTLEEQGYKIYNASSRGLSAPAGTPKEIVDILSEAIRKVINTEEHKKRMADMGLTLRYMNSDQYSKYWDESEEKLVKLLPLSKE